MQKTSSIRPVNFDVNQYIESIVTNGNSDNFRHAEKIAVEQFLAVLKSKKENDAKVQEFSERLRALQNKQQALSGQVDALVALLVMSENSRRAATNGEEG